MGALTWSEPTFWSTSLHAYERALAGWAKANGRGGPSTTMSRSRLRALMAEHPDKEPTP
jgi:hypothetical protein